jgi:hypothetical protein
MKSVYHNESQNESVSRIHRLKSNQYSMLLLVLGTQLKNFLFQRIILDRMKALISSIAPTSMLNIARNNVTAFPKA